MTVAEPVGKTGGLRLLNINNIRIILTCLVIATHCSIANGSPPHKMILRAGMLYTRPIIQSPFLLSLYNHFIKK